MSLAANVSLEFMAEAPGRSDVVIDRSIHSKQALMERIAQGLAFPAHFGANWDALIDCLSDLSWLSQAEVILDHSSLPRLPEQDLRLYVESLIDAADRRALDALPRLRFLFRTEDRASIASVLGAEAD